MFTGSFSSIWPVISFQGAICSWTPLWRRIPDYPTHHALWAPQYGIGVDALPQSARTSQILTGNNWGQLGSLMVYPAQAEIEEYGKTKTMRSLREEARLGCQYFPDLLHDHARKLLAEGKVSDALLTILQER